MFIKICIDIWRVMESLGESLEGFIIFFCIYFWELLLERIVIWGNLSIDILRFFKEVGFYF